MAKKDPERRATARIPLRIQIQYRTAEQFFRDYMLNLSTGGIFIETARPLKVGTRLKIQFCLPRMEKEILADGVVVRRVNVHGKNPGTGGMGIRFSDLDPKDKSSLDDYIQRQGLA